VVSKLLQGKPLEINVAAKTIMTIKLMITKPCLQRAKILAPIAKGQGQTFCPLISDVQTHSIHTTTRWNCFEIRPAVSVYRKFSHPKDTEI